MSWKKIEEMQDLDKNTKISQLFQIFEKATKSASKHCVRKGLVVLNVFSNGSIFQFEILNTVLIIIKGTPQQILEFLNPKVSKKQL